MIYKNLKPITRTALLLAICFTYCFTGCGKQTDSEPPIRISKEHPLYFEKSTGETWIPIATNYLPSRFRSNNDTAALALMEDYFRKFSQNGGNSMRIWISTEPLEIEDTREGEYNPEKFERIDKLLEFAEKYNIYIKFTLHHIRSINATSRVWSNNPALATSFQNIDEYLTTPKGINSYLNRARALAARYKNHKQIYAWELWNEMDAVRGGAWVDYTPVVLDSVKAIFPNRLVVQTLGSFDSRTAERSYQRYFGFKNNEFVSIHRYLDLGGQLESVKGDVDTLITSAMDFAHLFVKDRPIIMNEVGAVQPSHSGPFQYYKTDKEGMLLHDLMFAPFFSGSAGCGVMWHWDSYLYANDLWYHFQRFKNAIEGIDPIKDRMTHFRFETDGVRCFALGGNTKTIIWGRDTGNNWRTELEQGIPPQLKENVSISLSDLKSGAYRSARVYDPWKDRWTTTEIRNGRVAIPPFIRSFVVVLE